MVSSVNELIVLPFVDLAGLILRSFSIYITTYPIQFRWITIIAGGIAAAILFVLSRMGGRLYCNSLCPVGAILSVPARWPLLAHRINIEKCTSCGACERICKAEAIDSSLMMLDTSKCISCFNCSDVCRFDALKYGGKKNTGETAGAKQNEKNGRRDFLKKSASGSLLLLGLPVIARAGPKTVIPSGDSSIAIPPGSYNRDNFLSKCISCSLCISRCLGNVLQPASVGPYGLQGVGVPFMDYNRGSCEFECNICTRLCPSGAIQFLDIEKKKRVKIGEATFVKEFCIVETDKTSCGACGEICPSGAIEMLHVGDSADGALEIPLVNRTFCIGCGSCQFVCPVVEKNAIFVEARNPHGQAEVREEISNSENAEVDNDFAF
jgi:formate hydrogenlyase subunit 6/NADH:ubiquinone oxidoreductase subunit I